MPYTARRRYGRRVYRRRPAAIARRRAAYRTRRRFRPRVSFRRMIPGGFGRIKFAKLRYCEEVTINAGVASTATYVFRTNSLYDPNSTGVGHQPMGFDEWSARYARYAVLSSRCYMRYINTNNEDAVPAYFCVAVSALGTTFSGVAPTRLLENPHHSKVRVSGDTDVANEGVKNTTMASWDCKKWYKRNAIVDLNLHSDIGSNPTEMCYFECCCSSINGNDPAGHNFLITIYYNCAFFDPLDLVQS